MCVCVCVCACVCVCVCVSVCVYCMYVHMHVHVDGWVGVFICVYTPVCTVYIRTYVMYVHA